MSLITSKKERIRFLKFSFVGITGTIVDFGIMNLLRLVFEVPLVWAQAISFICAVINNFLWNRHWTYPESKSRSAHKQLAQFFIINIIGIAIRTPLVPWFNDIISELLRNNNWKIPLSNKVISQNLALAISIGIVTLWNYFANRYWTYNNVPVKKEDQASSDFEMQATEQNVED
jgi:putative flippase GtrA